MKLKISDIIVKDRFRKDLGDLTTLKESIHDIGLLHPVVVQKDTNRLIAGGRRMQACFELGWTDIPVTIIRLEDIVKGEFQENAVRKDFTLSESVEIVEFTIDWMDKHPDEAYKSTTDSAKRIRENAANFMQISHGQLWKMQQINRAIKEDPKTHNHIIEDVENGMSINYAHRSLKNVIRQNTVTPDIPKEKFELIEADFPWDYEIKLSASPTYKTMKLDEIKKEIPELPAYKDCILFLWATNPILDEAIELMEFYGFKYKTNLVWVKQKDDKIQTNIGHYVKGAHELLLIGTKGSPGVPPENVRVPSVVFAERIKHSSKPPIFTKIMNTYYSKKKKLSMFNRGRNKFHDKFWETWGIEANE